MSAGNYNIKADQGSTFQFQFTITSDSNITSTNLDGHWDLTGYSARMQVRSSASSATTALSLVSTADITLTSLGVVTVTVSAAAMAAVTAGNYVYDLEVQSASGIVTRLLQGKFVVVAEVTR